jgi:thiamine-phosphate pyrophosphorylase
VILIPSADCALDATTVLPLVAMTQKAGAAALIAGDARLARTVKADGVHLGVGESYAEARETVGRGAIVGGDAGGSRHDAMELGEAGADYVAFGVPGHDAESVTLDEEDARELRLELIDWWSEIFEPPCLALDVVSPDEARALADVGADFIAVTLRAGMTVADARDLVRACAAAIALAAPREVR